MFPLTGLPDALPQFLNLGLPGPALGKEIVSRLASAAVTPPTPAGQGRLRDLGQVGADCRVAGKELEVLVGDSLILFPEIFSYFFPLPGGAAAG